MPMYRYQCNITVLTVNGAFLHCKNLARSADDLLELSCSTDAHCKQFEGGICQDARCVCTARGKKEHRVNCQPRDGKLSNIIGGPCPCSQPHAECDKEMNLCLCAAGYTASQDRRRCLALQVPLDGPCELAHQCQLSDTFAVCHMPQKRCICKEHFEPHLGRCLGLLDLSCSNDTNCTSIGSAICLPLVQKCACTVGHVPNQKMTACVPAAAYGANCTSPAECQLALGAGASCHSNRCSCRIKHYPSVQKESNRTICEPLVAYGAYCRHTRDCHQRQTDADTETETDEDRERNTRMECMRGECGCRAGYYAVDNEFCVAALAGVNQLDKFLPLSILFTWLIYFCVW